MLFQRAPPQWHSKQGHYAPDARLEGGTVQPKLRNGHLCTASLRRNYLAEWAGSEQLNTALLKRCPPLHRLLCSRVQKEATQPSLTIPSTAAAELGKKRQVSPILNSAAVHEPEFVAMWAHHHIILPITSAQSVGVMPRVATLGSRPRSSAAASQVQKMEQTLVLNPYTQLAIK